MRKARTALSAHKRPRITNIKKQFKGETYRAYLCKK